VIRVVSVNGQLVEVEGRAAALVEWIARHQEEINSRELLNLEVHAAGGSRLKLRLMDFFEWPVRSGGGK
jgi:hypothetical protein